MVHEIYYDGAQLRRTKMTKRKLLNEIMTISKASIRRLARKGGVKRMHRYVHEDMLGCLKIYLGRIIRDATIYTVYANRKTISTSDIVYSLKRNNRTIYGYGF